MYRTIEHCLQHAICNCDMQHLQLVNGGLEHDTWNLMTCKRGNLNVSNFEHGDLEPEAFKLRHLHAHMNRFFFAEAKKTVPAKKNYFGIRQFL